MSSCGSVVPVVPVSFHLFLSEYLLCGSCQDEELELIFTIEYGVLRRHCTHLFCTRSKEKIYIFSNDKINRE